MAKLRLALLGAGLWLSSYALTASAQVFYPLNSGTASALTAVVYGNGRWVAVGRQNIILLSLDGFRWKQIQTGFGSGADFFSVAYGNGSFVAGGSGANLLCSSVNGTNWSHRASTSGTETIRGLAYGAGKFVAVGSASGSAYIATSPDAMNWTFRSFNGARPLNAVMYNSQYLPAFFVAVGDGGTIFTSSDGLSWTSRFSGFTSNLRAVSMGTYSTPYVAAGDSGVVVTSSDGQSWSPGAPASFNVRALGSYFDTVVSVGNFDLEGRIQSTSDARFWPGGPAQFAHPLNGISAAAYWYLPFVAVGENGLLLTSASGPAPLVNSWTKPTDGAWEESFWSLGESPLFWNQQVLFTNAGSKTLTIGPSTAIMHPDTLKVRDLLVNAAAGEQNLLFLTNASISTPLEVAGLIIGTNGSLLSLTSALNANVLEVAHRAVFEGLGQSRFGSVLVHSPGMAELLFSNGWFSAGNLTVGVDHWMLGDSPTQGAFTQSGGFNEVDHLTITENSAYNLISGSLHATNFVSLAAMSAGHFPGSAHLNVSGGAIRTGLLYLSGYDVTASLSGGTLGADSAEIWQGSFNQTAGVGTINTLVVIGISQYQLSGGELISRDTQVSAGSFSQLGGVHSNAKSLQIVGFETGNLSTYDLQGGTLASPSISVQGGRFLQGSRATNHTALLRIWSGGTFLLAGGELNTSNSVVGDPAWPRGLFTQTGGAHMVNQLDLLTSGTYDLESGTLSATEITLSLGSELRLMGGTLQNNGAIVLNGGTLTPAGTRQFGTLGISGSSSAVLNMQSGSAATLKFDDSHAVGWSSAQLQILNWNATVHHLSIGSNAQSLTPSQLNQIVFVSPAGVSGSYPAQLLASGELVPVLPGPLICMRAAQGLLLSWPAGQALYSSTNANGPYEFVTSFGPYSAPPTKPQQFFIAR